MLFIEMRGSIICFFFLEYPFEEGFLYTRHHEVITYINSNFLKLLPTPRLSVPFLHYPFAVSFLPPTTFKRFLCPWGLEEFFHSIYSHFSSYISLFTCFFLWHAVEWSSVRAKPAFFFPPLYLNATQYLTQSRKFLLNEWMIIKSLSCWKEVGIVNILVLLMITCPSHNTIVWQFGVSDASTSVSSKLTFHPSPYLKSLFIKVYTFSPSILPLL